MEKYRAIPEGYMRIGEIAKKAGVTVRTLSYYDKEGLLSPSGSSESGYRLYTDRDLAKLMQILMMKKLGFTLNEIKKRTANMNTTAEVMDILTEHAAFIRRKLEHLTDSLNALELLQAEIVQIDAVDFKKFAGILTHLQMKNERYWLIKYLDNDTLDLLKTLVPGEGNAERWIAATNGYVAEAAMLYDEGVSPESEAGQKLAKGFYGLVMEITGGDTALMQKINAQMLKSTSDEKHDEVMDKFRLFMVPAMGAYMGFVHPALSVGTMEAVNRLITEAVALHESGVLPESKKGLDFAERFWQWLMELAGGDMAVIQAMNAQFEANAATHDEATQKSLLFMKSSLAFYLNQQEGAKESD